MLEVDRLSKRIDEMPVLNDVSFSIPPGTITGIIGRNGAGKTTLLRTMAGILFPDRGEVRYNGQVIHRFPAEKGHILYVPESRDVHAGRSARQIAKLFALIYPGFDTNALNERLHQFALPSNKAIRNFSKGMKGLFYLSLAFAARTDVVLLDEPTEGLDPIFRKQALRLIVDEVAARRVSVVIASHRLEELQTICDQVIFLNQGRTESIADVTRLQERYRKLQIVYESRMPEAILHHPNVHLLGQSGRIYTLLVEGNQEEWERVRTQLEESRPLVIDPLPLNLEDIFVSRVGSEEYVR